MNDETTTVTERTAAPGSALADLRARRDKAKEALHLDLRVPRLPGAPVYVRFGPVPRAVIEDANKRAAESKDRDWAVIANAFVLAHCCIGVYAEVDGKPQGSPDTWPKFDADLAEILGLPTDSNATTIIRGLYLAEGDIIAAAETLSRWSAQVEQRAAEEFSGN